MFAIAHQMQHTLCYRQQGQIQNFEKGGEQIVFYKLMSLCGVLVEVFLCYRRDNLGRITRTKTSSTLTFTLSV